MLSDFFRCFIRSPSFRARATYYGKIKADQLGPDSMLKQQPVPSLVHYEQGAVTVGLGWSPFFGTTPVATGATVKASNYGAARSLARAGSKGVNPVW